MTYSYFQNAKFTGSYPTSKDMPAEEASEIAFCGRSNCGKSSVLNALTNNKKSQIKTLFLEIDKPSFISEDNLYGNFVFEVNDHAPQIQSN